MMSLSRRPTEEHVVPATSRDTQILLSGLERRYPGDVGVLGLDLEVSRGEFVVLLGPSGCGKTTTMRCLAGLETPDAGTIRVADRTVFDAAQGVNVSASKRRIGMVFQSYAIWPHKTVAENVGFPLMMQRMSKQQRASRIEEVLDIVGLEGLGGRSASDLSGGQMQRVALARSLAMRPDVLLMDEPLSNLDAKLRERLRIELKSLQQRLGATVVYVTHDQAEALAIADRIVVMNAGRIRQVATPLELYRAPATKFVATFMGTNNVIAAQPGPERSTVRFGNEIWRTDSVLASSAASVCIRAEDITLDAAAAPDNMTSASVEIASLLGSQVLYVVRTEAGLKLEVLAPAGAAILAPGTPVSVGIRADAVRCFDDAEDDQ